ncbi:hypothetical protein ACWU7L_004750, partial [Shigella sonnei]
HGLTKFSSGALSSHTRTSFAAHISPALPQAVFLPASLVLNVYRFFTVILIYHSIIGINELG